MRRKVHEIIAYDYSSKEEFEKHRQQMESKGWHLIQNGMFGGALDPREFDDDKYVYYANYIKSPFM